MDSNVKEIRGSCCEIIAALNSKLQKFESLVRACDYFKINQDPDLEKFIVSEFKRLTDYVRKSN